MLSKNSPLCVFSMFKLGTINNVFVTSPCTRPNKYLLFYIKNAYLCKNKFFMNSLYKKHSLCKNNSVYGMHVMATRST